jgi:hypothetical protein
MKTSTLKFALALTALSLFARTPAFAASVGTLQITVVDENGQVVPEAPVYIYGEHKTRFVGGKEIPGTTTMEMAAGDYRISSAIIKKTGDYVDRFASHEGHVRVVEGDNTAVILTLRPIQDPMSTIDYAELHKMGIPSKIARNLN